MVVYPTFTISERKTAGTAETPARQQISRLICYPHNFLLIFNSATYGLNPLLCEIIDFKI